MEEKFLILDCQEYDDCVIPEPICVVTHLVDFFKNRWTTMCEGRAEVARIHPNGELENVIVHDDDNVYEKEKFTNRYTITETGWQMFHELEEGYSFR